MCGNNSNRLWIVGFASCVAKFVEKEKGREGDIKAILFVF